MVYDESTALLTRPAEVLRRLRDLNRERGVTLVHHLEPSAAGATTVARPSSTGRPGELLDRWRNWGWTCRPWPGRAVLGRSRPAGRPAGVGEVVSTLSP